MKKVYFDLISGASGDMLLASLIDLGVPVDFLNKQYARMPLEQITIEAKKVERSGIQCTQIDPKFESANEYRHLHKILDIIRAGGFSEQVFNSCSKVLDAIASAEAKVHGVDKHHIHFHEIGAVDTILDIVGVCCALEYLEVENVEFSTITDGHGTIKTAHGVIPVPVPATACLISGFDLKIIDIPTELVTPTGAALLVTLGTQVKNMNGKVTATGYSCGTKVFDNHPNVLRSFLLDDSSDSVNHDSVSVLETDMDHISGEVMGHVAGLLFEKGALDVSWQSIYMKKGRPAYRLTVISKPENSQMLVDLIIINTRTLGVRIQNVDRVVATRSLSQVNFFEHDLIEKKCEYKGYCFSKLEYDALNALARERQIPLLELSELYIQQKSH